LPGAGHVVAAMAALAAAAVLAGCGTPGASVPVMGERPAPAVPQQWSQALAADAVRPDPAELAQWWQDFDDPVLSGLIERALQANAGVRAAQAALLQARALRDVARAGLSPSLGASGSVQRSHAGDTPGAGSWKAGLDASWEPDVFGRLGSAAAASEADLQAAAASLAQVGVSLAAEVALAYVDLRGLQARLAIARSNLAAQQETLQITAWRVQAGLASSLDLEQARAAAEQTRAQIPALQASLDKSAHALAVLGARTPADLSVLATEHRPLPQAPRTLALSFPADTLRQRPDLRVAEQRVLAALARVRQADAARLPAFTLAGSLGLAAARPAELLDAAALSRSLLAGFTATLFDGGALQAQLRAQQALLEQARAQYEAALLAALQDVEDALSALAGDRERLSSLQAAAEAAGNAELLARHRYASGLIDFRTVLDTQRTLLSAQNDLETTRATLVADHVRLYKALGGGWVPQPVTVN
jgi:NodT family efflux transporter outer membrane factor (OMF) lipoprotein